MRFYGLPQEYWRPQILFEIARGVGTPLILDEAVDNQSFSHYTRALVDIDLSKYVLDEIMVDMEGYAFYMVVSYERLSEFCTHCVATVHVDTALQKVE